MKLPLRLKLAKQQGEKLVRDLGINSLPVDPIEIAKQHDIVVQKKPDASGGVSGMLLRHGNNFGIMYATHIDNEGFQRFSIAHELGHYFQDGHPEHVFATGDIHVSHAGFVTSDPYELEADNFAAGLLMPSELFSPLLRRKEPGFDTIDELSEVCGTSLTATAIRYAELTEDAIAVIVSTGPTIDYCCLSEPMKSLKQINWLRKGSPLPLHTVTSAFNKATQRVLHGERDYADIDIVDWLGGIRSATATEEVVGLGNYGKTLTVLTCPSLIDASYQDIDEDEDNDLVESWTPRFHR